MGPKGDEPGQEDNRLSLDPNDPRWKKLLDEWNDGETYSVNVQIEQISPGEFRVTALKEGGGSEESETPPEKDTAEESSESAMQSKNPAVQSMLE